MKQTEYSRIAGLLADGKARKDDQIRAGSIMAALRLDLLALSSEEDPVKLLERLAKMVKEVE